MYVKGKRGRDGPETKGDVAIWRADEKLLVLVASRLMVESGEGSDGCGKLRRQS